MRNSKANQATLPAAAIRATTTQHPDSEACKRWSAENFDLHCEELETDANCCFGLYCQQPTLHRRARISLQRVKYLSMQTLNHQMRNEMELRLLYLGVILKHFLGAME